MSEETVGAKQAAARRSGPAAAVGVGQNVCPGATGSISSRDEPCAGAPCVVSLPRAVDSANTRTTGLRGSPRANGETS